MVKMVVLDVDGVIVGNKHGINFPYPNKKVIDALKKVRESGIPVVLCSGKYFFVVKPIIGKAGLDNPHITDAGGFIYNPAGNNISFEIDKNVLSSIINSLLSEVIYVEVYTETDYCTQKDKIPNKNLLKSRKAILQKRPKLVDSVIEAIKDKKIFKAIAFAMNEDEKNKIENIIKPFSDKISFVWSSHPTTGQIAYGLITSKTTSKPLAVKKVSNTLNISLQDTLGVGDTLGDWEFMKLCGYAAAMEDGSEELKTLVKSKGKSKYIIAPSVNSNGILKIFEYFLSQLYNK